MRRKPFHPMRFPVLAVLALTTLFATAACVRSARSTPELSVASAPLKPTDSPPLVAGLRLGDSLAHVRAVLGTPTSERPITGDAVELVYWPPGLAIVTTQDQGVALIGLLLPGSPELAGVRVGDPLPYVVQLWGPPHNRTGDRASYQFGDWGVLVMIDTASTPERIESITLGWSNKGTPSSITPPWPAPDTTRGDADDLVSRGRSRVWQIPEPERTVAPNVSMRSGDAAARRRMRWPATARSRSVTVAPRRGI